MAKLLERFESDQAIALVVVLLRFKISSSLIAKDIVGFVLVL